MTNPPQGSDEPGRTPGEQPDPDHQPTQPVPSFERPQQPGPSYGAPSQPYGQATPYGPYGQPQPGPGSQYGQSHGQPGQPPSQPYGAPQYGAPQQYGQPQPYGVPQQYGQPAGAYEQPPAPSRSRIGLIAGVTAAILVLIAVGVVLAMTMSSTVLDRNAVQRDVAAQFEEREGVAIDLECAEEMKVSSGATYGCTGTTADGEDVTLQISITDEETAAYTWTEP